MFYVEFYNFGETGDHGDQFLNFQFVGCTEFVLHVGPFVLLPVFLVVAAVTGFWSFGFSCLFREIEFRLR